MLVVYGPKREWLIALAQETQECDIPEVARQTAAEIPKLNEFQLESFKIYVVLDYEKDSDDPSRKALAEAIIDELRKNALIGCGKQTNAQCARSCPVERPCAYREYLGFRDTPWKIDPYTHEIFNFVDVEL